MAILHANRFVGVDVLTQWDQLLAEPTDRGIIFVHSKNAVIKTYYVCLFIFKY